MLFLRRLLQIEKLSRQINNQFLVGYSQVVRPSFLVRVLQRFESFYPKFFNKVISSIGRASRLQREC